jgi:uncharacterized Zn-finger protein
MAPGASSPTPLAGTTETVIVESRVVACDGSGGPLGHPRVWLRIVDSQTVCPYCSRIFALRPDHLHLGAGDGHGH